MADFQRYDGSNNTITPYTATGDIIEDKIKFEFQDIFTTVNLEFFSIFTINPKF